jgi:hypothetical protein
MEKYTAQKWLNRIQNRSDITAHLTHLTKGNSKNNAIKNLILILKEEKIIGSGKIAYVTGDQTAVCFQDTPIYNITQNIIHENK